MEENLEKKMFDKNGPYTALVHETYTITQILRTRALRKVVEPVYQPIYSCITRDLYHNPDTKKTITKKK